MLCPSTPSREIDESLVFLSVARHDAASSVTWISEKAQKVGKNSQDEGDEGQSGRGSRGKGGCQGWLEDHVVGGLRRSFDPLSSFFTNSSILLPA